MPYVADIEKSTHISRASARQMKLMRSEENSLAVIQRFRAEDVGRSMGLKAIDDLLGMARMPGLRGNGYRAIKR
jgi:hypothetical protein